LIATGSEVHIALEAKKKLKTKDIYARVVSMPSWELFDKSPKSYKNEVLPPAVENRLAIEAGISMGWSKYVGSQGSVIGIDHFGASAPGSKLLAEFGFSVDNIVSQAKAMLGK
jgi:transketolase